MNGLLNIVLEKLLPLSDWKNGLACLVSHHCVRFVLEMNGLLNIVLEKLLPLCDWNMLDLIMNSTGSCCRIKM